MNNPDDSREQVRTTLIATVQFPSDGASPSSPPQPLPTAAPLWRSSLAGDPLTGDSERHSPVLQAQNDEDGRANTEGAYSPTIVAPSPLATARCGIGASRDRRQEIGAELAINHR
jgi:hypothetical protein